MGKPFKILSIDGGGMRGIIPVTILQGIENYVKEQQSIKGDFSLVKEFDLIAGTSTGGLLACALTAPKDKGANKKEPKYNLEQISKMYTDEGKDIFPVIDNYDKWVKGLKHAEYSPSGLEKVLDKYLETKKLTIYDAIAPIFIPAFNIKENRPVIFKTRKAKNNPNRNPTMFDVCKATSAAPTFLPAHEFDYDDKKIVCIDGGVFMNNPSISAVIEVLKHKEEYEIPDLQDQDIFVLSISTGHHNDQTVDIEKAKSKAGKWLWSRNIADIMIGGHSNSVHYIMEKSLRFKQSNYLRVDIILKDRDSCDLTNSTKTMMDYWVKCSEDYFNNTSFIDNMDDFLRRSQILK